MKLHTSLKLEDVVEDALNLEEIGLDKKIASQIHDLIKQRFKPQIVEISGVLELSSYESNGLEIVKKALSELMAYSITYISGKCSVAYVM